MEINKNEIISIKTIWTNKTNEGNTSANKILIMTRESTIVSDVH